MKAALSILAFAVIAAATLGIVFVIGVRTKSPTVLRAVKGMNRSFWNPRAMKTAGQPGAFAGIIRHVGRTSGRPYETPIGPFPTEDGFVIALPYSTTADWLKNVMVAGEAELVYEGDTYLVNEPQVVAVEDVASHLPDGEIRNLRSFNVTEFLSLHTVSVQRQGSDAPELSSPEV